MIVLVTGGRDFRNTTLVNDVLSKLDVDLLIQGGCTGADREAKEWADKNGVHHATIPKAGPIRNSAMTKLNIDLCIAFPGNRGTADMIKKCRANGIEVMEVHGL